MCSFTAVVKRVVPFVVAFIAGMLGFSLIAQMVEPVKVATAVTAEPSTEPARSTSKGGVGIGGGIEPRSPVIDGAENYKIRSKPGAQYTDDARANNVEGTVRLKVVLLASGKLGNIWAVSELPNGLTEQAIAAARQITFHPKRINGVPHSVIVTVDYNFNLY